MAKKKPSPCVSSSVGKIMWLKMGEGWVRTQASHSERNIILKGTLLENFGFVFSLLTFWQSRRVPVQQKLSSVWRWPQRFPELLERNYCEPSHEYLIIQFYYIIYLSKFYGASVLILSDWLIENSLIFIGNWVGIFFSYPLPHLSIQTLWLVINGTQGCSYVNCSQRISIYRGSWYCFYCEMVLE